MSEPVTSKPPYRRFSEEKTRESTTREELSLVTIVREQNEFITRLRGLGYSELDIAHLVALPFEYDPQSQDCKHSHVGRALEWLSRIP